MFGIICIHLWPTQQKQATKGKCQQNPIRLHKYQPKNYLKASPDHKKAAFATKHGHSAWKTGAFMAGYHYSASVASQQQKSKMARRNEINTDFVRFWLRTAYLLRMSPTPTRDNRDVRTDPWI
ncbi:hypothetical protein HNP10_000960 [Aeromonas veronii]|uniref:hypothetical protein n=1 Tax=Aeromonas veronii TaxID=654 RepID=UPI001609DC34|nr:hypothetical protein [Aeromonas veronii]MCS3832245.1 hypothetical protein [Aeromonas veronii]